MRSIHLANAARRDATVAMASLVARREASPGAPGKDVRLLRSVACTEEGTDAALTRRFGADYGQALVDGDPEVDMEVVGRPVGRTSRVLVTEDGAVLHASPEVVDVIFEPDGSERERKAAADREGNIAAEAPVRWTGLRLPKADAVRRFVFARTLQVRHVDGLTFDFLREMARELAAAGVLVRLAAGPSGKEPLVMQLNGTPYQGFLEGRVDGERYMLLLHLSNQELKRAGGAE